LSQFGCQPALWLLIAAILVQPFCPLHNETEEKALVGLNQAPGCHESAPDSPVTPIQTHKCCVVTHSQPAVLVVSNLTPQFVTLTQWMAAMPVSFLPSRLESLRQSLSSTSPPLPQVLRI